MRPDEPNDLMGYVDPMSDEDDVEGHGLREVAVGLGAAAVVGAGGAAAFATAPPSPTHPAGPAAVSSVQSVSGSVTQVVDQAVAEVGAKTQAHGTPQTNSAHSVTAASAPAAKPDAAPPNTSTNAAVRSSVTGTQRVVAAVQQDVTKVQNAVNTMVGNEVDPITSNATVATAAATAASALDGDLWNPGPSGTPVND